MSWSGYVLMTFVCAIKVFSIDGVFFADTLYGRFHLLGKGLLYDSFRYVPTDVFLIIRLFFLVTAFFLRYILYFEILIRVYFLFIKRTFFLDLNRRRQIVKLNMDSRLNVNFWGTSGFYKHTIDIEEIETFLTII